MNGQPIYSLAISGRMILDLHALNNEGSEGNQLMSRQVYVVTPNGQSDQDGRRYPTARVNAISGDMLKHIQVEHLQRIALRNGLPLSRGARQLNANRINVDFDGDGSLKQATDSAVIDRIIRACVVTDMAGILVTANNRSTPRKSVAEFGWAVGVPEYTRTESYIHTKYVADSRREREPQRQASADSGTRQEAAEGSNLGQNLFQRPASSGVYAVACHLELARIAFNDQTQQYPSDITDEDRQRRCRALLESVLYTFLQLDGAHRNTQAPHVVAFEGAITTSHTIMPAPAFSALHDGFREQIESIAQSLNSLSTHNGAGAGSNAIVVHPFDTLADFATRMTEIINSARPFKLVV